MRPGDDRVGPRSWYWPTRYKLLVALVIVIAGAAMVARALPKVGI